MYITFLILSVIMVISDLATKYLVTSSMALNETLPLIDNIFHLTYVRNSGAAFSMLSGQRIILILLPLLIISVIIIYIIFKRPTNKSLMLSFTMIVSGGIGNLIDRIKYGYVIDFFDFRLINFPVFNVADIFVTLGATIFIILLLFSKEEII